MSAKLEIVSPAFQELDPGQVRRWIESGEPRSVIDVLVTPAIARVLLEFNDPGDTNRMIRRTGVVGTIAAIKSGEWENTGEPIIMSDSRLLNDGQHRLQAIVEADTPAVMDIRFGVKRHAFASTNSGRKRSGGDALQIAGVINSHAVSVAARLILAYEDGLPRAISSPIGNGKLVLALERWPDIPDCMRYSASLPAKLRIAATQALGYFARKSANEAAVQTFFSILLSGEGSASNPPHQYREWLYRRPAGQGSTDRVRALAVGIIAWNAYRRGEKIAKLDWRPSQPFPKVEKLRH
jgi:hypothetical protein